MIMYNGNGDHDKVTIALIGDNESKLVEIELSKPPFSLNFQGVFPRHWTIRMQDGEKPSVVSMQGSTLHLEWENALPAPEEGTASPRTQMEFYMWYGLATGPIHKRGKARRY